MWTLWSLLGCGSSVFGEPDPEPYLPTVEIEVAEPTLSTEDLQRMVPPLLEGLAQRVPAQLPAVIEAFMVHAEGGCPYLISGSEGTSTYLQWYDDCVTPSGAVFSGGLELTIETDSIGDYGEVRSGFELYTDNVNMSTPDGKALSGGGYFAAFHTDGDDYATADAYLSGQLQADPATAGDDPWLTGEMSGMLNAYAADWNGYHVLYATGSWPIDDGGPLVAVALQDVVIEPGWCSNEPFGTLSVREDNGVWHDVVFAYYDEEADKLVNCDGCGAHLVAGANGDDGVCVPGSTLEDIVDWTEGLPW